ncbi:MAG TPA: alpha-amylase family glycosyl hydrolase, partial [Reyranella sp.]|nr:alpha-amylase family glycosyl hydrolase [Reyranella sp.]
AVNPYDMQEHKFSKSQPENVVFLKRVRKLLDEFPGTTTVGEVGDSHVGLKLMGEYTSGGDKLHMAYTFDMLGNEFTAEHFRSKMKRFFDSNPDGWPCWSFSNHDVDRHVSRWSRHALDRTTLAKQAAGMIIALKGSICIYQGEELGLPQADILFEELTDPPGIRFWPEYKGRDGERTPMPWDEGEAPNGFSTAKPWLPVKPEHSALSVAAQNADPDSVLNFYRAALAFRRAHPALIGGDIEFFKVNEPLLAFRRRNADESLVCVYNLSAGTLKFAFDGDAELLLGQDAERLKGKLTLGANGWGIFNESGDNPLHIEFKRRAKKPSN